MNKNKITSFKDLIVYQNTYKAALIIIKQILPLLPREEKYDLKDQLLRSTKAVPRLIAEGYSKKHQRKGFQKYLDDALGESNETIVGLEQVKDIYNIKPDLCNKMIAAYDQASRQIYRLAEAWDKFTNSRIKPSP